MVVINLINWNVRFKNKAFWLSFVPAVILVIETVGKLFGFEFDLSNINENLSECINAIFILLAVVGIVIDPTTEGVGDSKQALTYSEPRADE